MTEVNHECLRLMVEACKWQEIVVATESLTSAQASQPGYSFYRGMALTKLDRVSEAVEQIHHGLSLDPSSRWGNKLLFDVMRSSGKITEAFKGFSEFIDSQQGLESEKAWYVQHAAELSLFDIAAAMNQRREVICSVPPRPKYALALQCFCKADTLDQVFSSLCKLDRATAYALVILQDSEASSNDYHRYAGACEDVRAVISKWHSRLVNSFASVECMANRSNLGTAPSCRRLIDYVTQVYEGFLFIEDDCILAPSALDWSTYHIENTISSTGPAFVTCESSYFDKGDRVNP
jgi:tetratricopeptide (TPR) repeat protein